MHAAKSSKSVEHVRREFSLGNRFAVDDFERALRGFRQIYNVAPQRVACSPDVLRRFCVLFERSEDDAERREIRFEGIPLVAAILPAGTIAFEGEVDEGRMGDW